VQTPAGSISATWPPGPASSRRVGARSQLRDLQNFFGRASLSRHGRPRGPQGIGETLGGHEDAVLDGRPESSPGACRALPALITSPKTAATSRSWISPAAIKFGGQPARGRGAGMSLLRPALPVQKRPLPDGLSGGPSDRSRGARMSGWAPVILGAGAKNPSFPLEISPTRGIASGPLVCSSHEARPGRTARGKGCQTRDKRRGWTTPDDGRKAG